jgi:hypothetical protein
MSVAIFSDIEAQAESPHAQATAAASRAARIEIRPVRCRKSLKSPPAVLVTRTAESSGSLSRNP